MAVELEVSDSLVADSPGLTHGIVLEAQPEPEVRPLGETDTGMSWILSGMFVLFLIVCVRYRKNTRYLSVVFHDIFEVKERHNAFDDTLRETSFLWLLNALWCGAGGVILYGFLYYSPGGALFAEAADIKRLGICIGMATAYTLFLTAAYATVSNLFSVEGKASLWVKGYMAVQGVEGILLFPVALVGMCVPGLMAPMVTIGIIIFITAKILFIYKGFCIFFTEIATWVLFLYYLCSLELVPIVLTCAAAGYLCEKV